MDSAPRTDRRRRQRCTWNAPRRVRPVCTCDYRNAVGRRISTSLWDTAQDIVERHCASSVRPGNWGVYTNRLWTPALVACFDCRVARSTATRGSCQSDGRRLLRGRHSANGRSVAYFKGRRGPFRIQRFRCFPSCVVRCDWNSWRPREWSALCSSAASSVAPCLFARRRAAGRYTLYSSRCRRRHGRSNPLRRQRARQSQDRTRSDA